MEPEEATSKYYVPASRSQPSITANPDNWPKNAVDTESDGLVGQYADLKRRFAELEAANRDLHAARHQLQGENERLSKDCDAWREEYNRLEKKYYTRTDQLQETRMEISQYAEEISNLRYELDQRDQQTAELSDEQPTGELTTKEFHCGPFHFITVRSKA